MKIEKDINRLTTLLIRKTSELNEMMNDGTHPVTQDLKAASMEVLLSQLKYYYK